MNFITKYKSLQIIRQGVGILAVSIAVLLLPGFLSAQSQTELEERRRRLLKDIGQTTQLLNATKKNKEAALDRYLTLQRQINKRQKLIETLRSEIELTDQSIDRANVAVESLRADTERLQAEYAEMLRNAYRLKLNNSTLLFLFSSGSFNEAYRRYRYLQQYDAYRSKQAFLITETQNTLRRKAAQAEEKRTEKQALLQSSEEQNTLLSKELNVSDRLLTGLKKDEKRLTGDLNKQRARHEKLNVAIENIIKDVMTVRRRNTRKPNLSTADKKEEADLKALSGSFEKNKGRLPMPVRGVITKYYGKQKHPTIKNITIDNPGIDIKTAKGAEVRAVFRGEVAGIQFIPGYNYMVLIKHGKYYTAYSNLAELKVERGQKISTRAVIGKVSTDRITNTSALHFEVWREKTRLNPVRWVR